MNKMNQKSENETDVKNVDNLNILPHLESLERMLNIPVVGAAFHQGQTVYETVKCHNRMLNWAFSTAEGCITTAITTAAPIVSKFDRPIQYVDQTLVKGIDKLQVKAPIIKEQPSEIYNQAKNKVIEVVQPICALRVAGQQKAASLKDLSWQKANEVLATQYGTMAVNGLDNTSALAERLLDYYFPKIENEPESDNVPISATDDPVLHTVQTVGRLSNKVARRVYCTVSHQIKQLKKEDVQEYVASLIAVLRLTEYLNYLNERMHHSQNAQQQQQQHQQSSHQTQSNNDSLVMDSILPKTPQTITLLPTTTTNDLTKNHTLTAKLTEQKSKTIANGKSYNTNNSNGTVPKNNINKKHNSNNYDSNNDKLD